jgi:hypothetical protein
MAEKGIEKEGIEKLLLSCILKNIKKTINCVYLFSIYILGKENFMTVCRLS